MGRLTRIIDAVISLAEAAIERFSDPDGVRLLRESLEKSDRFAAALVDENCRLTVESDFLKNRLEYLEREFRDVRSQLLSTNASLMSVTRANVIATVDDALEYVGCYCGLKFQTDGDFRDHLPCLPYSGVT